MQTSARVATYLLILLSSILAIVALATMFDDCPFGSEWSCYLILAACVLTFILSFATVIALCKCLRTESGNSRYSALFCVLDLGLTILWIVSSAGIVYHWGQGEVNIPDDNFNVFFQKVGRMFFSSQLSVITWIFISFLNFEYEIDSQQIPIARIILYSVALLSGVSLFNIVAFKGYAMIDNTFSRSLECSFDSGVVCRLAFGSGYAASVLYAVLLPLCFIVAKQINKIAILWDSVMGLLFIASGLVLANKFGFDDVNKKEKIAATAMAFVGFLALLTSVIFDLILHCRNLCCCHSSSSPVTVLATGNAVALAGAVVRSLCRGYESLTPRVTDTQDNDDGVEESVDYGRRRRGTFHGANGDWK
eukprot:m.155970 g.155970  ORF g.155970 m.155970 type:complete len:363 (+) comp38683_c0_seq6:339-1427(+)